MPRRVRGRATGRSSISCTYQVRRRGRSLIEGEHRLLGRVIEAWSPGEIRPPPKHLRRARSTGSSNRTRAFTRCPFDRSAAPQAHTCGRRGSTAPHRWSYARRATAACAVHRHRTAGRRADDEMELIGRWRRQQHRCENDCSPRSDGLPSGFPRSRPPTTAVTTNDAALPRVERRAKRFFRFICVVRREGLS